MDILSYIIGYRKGLQALPKGYTKLKWVGAYATEYVYIGLNETQAYRAKYKVRIQGDNTKNGGLHILSSQNIYFPFLKSYDPSMGHDRIGAKNAGNENPTSGTTEFNWEHDRDYVLEGYVNGSYYVDGVEIGVLPRGNTASASNQLTLFAYGGNPSDTGYRFIGRFYWGQVFDENGKLLRDFIPCKTFKNNRNVAGLYDRVTGVFFESESGGSLTPGEVDE